MLSSLPLWKTQSDAAALSSDHPDIINASHEAYGAVYDNLQPERPSDETHIQPACDKASEYMTKALAEMGYIAHIFHASKDGTEGGFHHNYPILRSARGVLVADPTWCQFLEYDLDMSVDEILGFPQVLVGTRPEVIAFAKAAGLGESTLNLWRRDHGSITTDRYYALPDEAELYWDRVLSQ